MNRRNNAGKNRITRGMKGTCIRRQSRRGNAIVEFALVAPLILLLLLAIFDFGIYAYAFISVQNAVRVAALRNSGGMESAADQQAACALAVEELRGLPNIGTGYTAACGASPVV